MPRLVATREGRVVSVIPLHPGSTVLGSDASADLLLPDEPFVSRYHCTVRFDGRRLWVTDTSTNGTYLRGSACHRPKSAGIPPIRS